MSDQEWSDGDADSPAPRVVILAGPNGAGKTTSSRTLLAEQMAVMTFVNADVIAQGLSGFSPDTVALRAGRIMLDRLRELAESRRSFAFETTLAGRSYAGWLSELRLLGYEIHLHYFWLTSADLAVMRVAERSRRGGHSIPEPTIRQRYERSLDNLFDLYLPLADLWSIYNNSVEGLPEIIARGGQEIEICDHSLWKLITSGRRFHDTP